MGHFSMEKSLNPGSALGGNQQRLERENAKLRAERDEARAEVARYWTSADMKPWVDLAEQKGLGHFGRKLKGMFSRAMKAEDDARQEYERAEDLSGQLTAEKAAREKAEREYLRVWNERDAQRRRAETAERQLDLAEKLAVERAVQLAERDAELARCKEVVRPFAMTPYANDGLGDADQEICAGINLGHLRAARAALSGSGDGGWPLGYVTVRATDTGDGIIINTADAKEWGLREDAPYVCTWVDDTHVRIAVPAASPSAGGKE